MAGRVVLSTECHPISPRSNVLLPSLHYIYVYHDVSKESEIQSQKWRSKVELGQKGKCEIKVNKAKQMRNKCQIKMTAWQHVNEINVMIIIHEA